MGLACLVKRMQMAGQAGLICSELVSGQTIRHWLLTPLTSAILLQREYKDLLWTVKKIPEPEIWVLFIQ